MNRKRKSVLLLGGTIATLFLAFPPQEMRRNSRDNWRPAVKTEHFLDYDFRIAKGPLTVRVLAVFIATGVLIAVLDTRTHRVKPSGPRSAQLGSEQGRAPFAQVAIADESSSEPKLGATEVQDQGEDPSLDELMDFRGPLPYDKSDPWFTRLDSR